MTDPPSVSAAILRINEAGLIASANPLALELIGLPAAELVGKPARDVFGSRKELADLIALCEPGCREKMVKDHPIRLCGCKGEPFRPALATIIPLIGAPGSEGGAIICLQEISETEHIRQVALDCLAEGVFTTDTDLKITSFNKTAESITKRTQTDVIGRPCGDILQCHTCGDTCFLQDSIKEQQQTGDHAVFIKDSTGTRVPVNLNTAPLCDDQGRAIGGIASFHDNTHSLGPRLVLDSIADGVFTVDRKWKVTSFNRAAEAITGWSADDAVGKSCSEVFQSSLCGRNCAIAESLYSGRPASNRSITIRNHAGDEVPVSISASPLADHEGNIIGGVETIRDLRALTSLRNQVTARYHFDEMVSKSKVMQRIFAIMPDIAASPSTVLIYGESGTGKEMIARALYKISDRRDKPFIALNCGAIPESLLESELFGYKAGAFTDARKDKQGRFAAAEGGMLFLDEIGDIPISIQAKLLRVLQEKVYEPLGSNTPVESDVRIITATNRDLKAMVIDGAFREDLYYRLNVVRIHLPPLRERKEDIPLLAKQIISEISAQQGKDIVGISSPALSLLMHYDFPGNIRELKNIIEYAFILCDGGYIQAEHLPEQFEEETGRATVASVEPKAPQTLDETEKRAILLALENNNWKKVSTCWELGISKDTLRRKMRKHKLERPNIL